MIAVNAVSLVVNLKNIILIISKFIEIKEAIKRKNDLNNICILLNIIL